MLALPGSLSFSAPRALAVENEPTTSPSADVSRAEATPTNTLEDQLLRVAAAELVAEAMQTGDARRGAITFFQPHLACAKCHDHSQRETALGPNLAQLPAATTNEQLVEAVLEPSKLIRPEFRIHSLVMHDGTHYQGLLHEESEQTVVLRDVGRNGLLTTLEKTKIDERTVLSESLMPRGQVNQLASRQQFLDLVRYLIELRVGGVARAVELRPDPSLISPLTLPDYEQRVDHRGLIASWNDESLARGEAIYRRVCANCHGTVEAPGSLPTSLRFAQGRFKNGSDPYSLYQTITRGFGFMTPQTWMVPRQKYDVIHYIRETYLRPHNPTQWVAMTDEYLARLPEGDTFGPEPSSTEPWVAMDYGRCLMHTYEVPDDGRFADDKQPNIAQKGIAVRLDSGAGGVTRGRHWIVWDHDTMRMAAACSGEQFMDYHGIQFDGQHGIHPELAGDCVAATPVGPGWAHPVDNSWDDRRLVGRDGRHYGPLPRDWVRYRGRYQVGSQTILSYDVGQTPVLERADWVDLKNPALTDDQVLEGNGVFSRTLHLGPRSRPLMLLVASFTGGTIRSQKEQVVEFRAGEDEPANAMLLAGAWTDTGADLNWRSDDDGRLTLEIPAGDHPLRLAVWFGRPVATLSAQQMDDRVRAALGQPLDLTEMQKELVAQWPERVTTSVSLGDSSGPFAVDTLQSPDVNPWLAQTRFTGIDFFEGGDEAAVCSWDGDVWIVSGLRQSREGTSPATPPTLSWQRIAAGLFQPLGLKRIKGQIYVTCRDQIVILRDLNGDRETDYYECFNNDHQVTEHFHEFAMGLQTDDEGNLYYAKSARHALRAVVPHHGTLLRVSADGQRTDILANGFRAANGVCLNPDGSFIVTDQEGHWNPKNRINWVTLDPRGKPKFYGNMFGYHDVVDESDSAMQQPLCWITNEFDRSPAELLWIPKDAWGPLGGSLLNLSYGYGQVYLVPHEDVPAAREGDRQVDEQPFFPKAMDDRLTKQGGMIALPIPRFPSGTMRGRFHPETRDLYLCGMFAWAGNATAPGGFYRLRYTGKPVYLPTELHANREQLILRFSERLAADSVRPEQFALRRWSLRRSADYGSDHYGEQTLKVTGARLAEDGRTVMLDVPDLGPTWSIETRYDLRGAAGEPIQGTLHHTIHRLR